MEDEIDMHEYSTLFLDAELILKYVRFINISPTRSSTSSRLQYPSNQV